MTKTHHINSSKAMTTTIFKLRSTSEYTPRNNQPSNILTSAWKDLHQRYRQIPVHIENKLQAICGLHLLKSGEVIVDNNDIMFPGFSHPVIPSNCFHGALVSLGKKTSRKLSRDNIGLVSVTESSLDIPTDADDITEHQEIMMLKSNHSSLKELRSRIKVPDWSATLKVTHQDKLSAEMLLQGLVRIGNEVGIGDSRNFGGGKFKVTECTSTS